MKYKFLLIMLISKSFLHASCMYPRRDLPIIAIDWVGIRTYHDLAHFLASKGGFSAQCIDLIEPANRQVFLSVKKDPAYALVGLVKRVNFDQQIDFDIKDGWVKFGLLYGLDNSRK